ncbi:STAS/SEC14 domain-containing protein [Polyangium aurulentum]|uniref:STAS/SEC14 domain-containing protein n=1 Tax=Polyangium aurulentum TaxID=2567896 RepID=UPI0010AEA413|nr:STAS/SEC14 domain-containing protein [Polyangium aurulentum]UQA55806.1 STAS/SEC14 domain-containing protein [Polyangium aurulentum]
MREREEWICGQQRVWVEAPDLVRLELHGIFALPDVDAYMPIIFELGDRLGPFTILVDMRDLKSIPAATRKRITNSERMYPYRACAVYGASFTLGVMVTMTFKAGRMLMPSTFPFPVAVFEGEGEARAWLAPHRDRQSRAV